MQLQSLLISGTMAAVLGLAPAAAFADRDDHRYRGKQWHQPGSHERFERHPQHLRKYPQTQWRGYRYTPPRYAPRGYYRRPFTNHWPWVPGTLGGLWLGSAITHNYLHDRSSDCTHDCRYVAPQTRREVTGCFRIERRPDGREVRVELPAHACW